MTVKIEGKHAPCPRKITGLYSLDHACINDEGELGVPINTGHEYFGRTGIGKSTFVFSLAGILTESNIVLSAFEPFDSSFLESILTTVGFDGTIKVLNDPEDEEQLMDLTQHLRSKEKREYSVGIIDSISAISPIAETEGEYGEAHMGRRAFLLAQLSRRMTKIFRFSEDSSKTLLATNHWIPRMGSRGYTTPGGEIKNFLFTVRVLLRRKSLAKRATKFPDGSYVLEGEVYKNRWGYDDNKFTVFMLAGRGLHKGLTALWDAKELKLIAYRSGVIKIDGEKYGTMKTMLKEAKEGNDEIFEPFVELLNDIDKGNNTANGNETDNKD